MILRRLARWPSASLREEAPLLRRMATRDLWLVTRLAGAAVVKRRASVIRRSRASAAAFSQGFPVHSRSVPERIRALVSLGTGRIFFGGFAFAFADDDFDSLPRFEGQAGDRDRAVVGNCGFLSIVLHGKIPSLVACRSYLVCGRRMRRPYEGDPWSDSRERRASEEHSFSHVYAPV